MDRKLDRDALKSNDGKEGRPTYVAHGERVIDVSESPLWDGGLHMGIHRAGNDLTAEISAAPHGLEVLERYPQVAILEKEEKNPVTAPTGSTRPDTFLTRHPFFRRHPHPATVHFPIVLSLCTTVFYVLYVITGVRSFEASSVYCLVGDVIFTPVAIVTGLLTWWINYGARRMRPILIKQFLSFFLFVDLVVLLALRWADPTVVLDPWGRGFLYLLLALALTPAALEVSYYGGRLTFPLEKH